MALLETPRAPALSAIVSFRAVSAIMHAIAAVAAWNDARRTRDILSRLSVHELDDIGLCRGDIDDIARRILR